MRDPTSQSQRMVIEANIGFATSLLELAATSVGYGMVVGGFVAAGGGMLNRRSRRELEASALRNGFWGGLMGMSCLCFDLIFRYPF